MAIDAFEPLWATAIAVDPTETPRVAVCHAFAFHPASRGVSLVLRQHTVRVAHAGHAKQNLVVHTGKSDIRQIRRPSLVSQTIVAHVSIVVGAERTMTTRGAEIKTVGVVDATAGQMTGGSCAVMGTGPDAVRNAVAFRFAQIDGDGVAHAAIVAGIAVRMLLAGDCAER